MKFLCQYAQENGKSFVPGDILEKMNLSAGTFRNPPFWEQQNGTNVPLDSLVVL